MFFCFSDPDAVLAGGEDGVESESGELYLGGRCHLGVAVALDGAVAEEEVFVAACGKESEEQSEGYGQCCEMLEVALSGQVSFLESHSCVVNRHFVSDCKGTKLAAKGGNHFNESGSMIYDVFERGARKWVGRGNKKTG